MTGEFDNMCTEGLTLHKDFKTDCSINTTIKGKNYCFGSEQGKADFMKNPDANLAKAQEYYSSTYKKMQFFVITNLQAKALHKRRAFMRLVGKKARTLNAIEARRLWLLGLAAKTLKR